MAARDQNYAKTGSSHNVDSLTEIFFVSKNSVRVSIEHINSVKNFDAKNLSEPSWWLRNINGVESSLSCLISHSRVWYIVSSVLKVKLMKHVIYLTSRPTYLSAVNNVR